MNFNNAIIINFFRTIILIIFFFSSSVFCQNRTVDDISNWNHPVHKVLEKNNVTLHKVSFFNNGVYPVFFVDFPYDPLASPNNTFFNKLYFDVLRANGYWDYSFDDKTDKVVISISWDKKLKKMQISYAKKDNK
ncbi:MAG: hypothetical protein NTV43_16835 [Methylococcales bacterium]|nr:hypothetical protein [Methylococcales bacterium]